MQYSESLELFGVKLCEGKGMVLERKSRLNSGNSIICLLVLLFRLLTGASAALYAVGGSSGWIELSSGSVPYDDQFKNITLAVGDTLVFEVGGGHTLLRVSNENLANCNATKPLDTEITTEVGDVNLPVSVILDSPGYWGFICGVGNHCSQGGMHLAVNVSDSVTSVTTPPSLAQHPNGVQTLAYAPLAVLTSVIASLAILIVCH